MVPGTGIEPVRPLCRKAADFKSAVSTNFTTRAHDDILEQKRSAAPNGEACGKCGWRRDPESNRAARICNPVHNRFAIAPMCFAPADCKHRFAIDKKGKPQASLCGMWSGKRVSNSRPQPWQGCALPTELFPRFLPRIIAHFHWPTRSRPASCPAPHGPGGQAVNVLPILRDWIPKVQQQPPRWPVQPRSPGPLQARASAYAPARFRAPCRSIARERSPGHS